MATTKGSRLQYQCSFCAKSQDQVKKLIAGPGVYICDECVDLCKEILEEDEEQPLGRIGALELGNQRVRRIGFKRGHQGRAEPDGGGQQAPVGPVRVDLGGTEVMAARPVDTEIETGTTVTLAIRPERTSLAAGAPDS